MQKSEEVNKEMVKIRCINCGDVGYAASPDYLICKCGGRFKAIPKNGESEKVELDEETNRLFDTSGLIK